MHESYLTAAGHFRSATSLRSQPGIETMLSALIQEASRLQAALRQSPSPESGRDGRGAPISARDIDKLMRRRAERNQLFGLDLFSDPAWDLLLALYSAHLWQRREPIGSVTIASGLSASTALRWLTRLEEHRLVRLSPDQLDGRRRFAELSSEGVKAMNECFRDQDQPKLAA